jgi:hypothetical protein
MSSNKLKFRSVVAEPEEQSNCMMKSSDLSAVFLQHSTLRAIVMAFRTFRWKQRVSWALVCAGKTQGYEMKSWISAAALTATIAFSGTLMSTGAIAASQHSQKASTSAKSKATDVGASRRHHRSHRHHAHRGHHRMYGSGYARHYRSQYLQPAYSGYDYGGWQPAYYGGGYYGGYGRPFGFGGFGFGHGFRHHGGGFGHAGYGHHGGFGHGGFGHGGFGHGGGGHH